MYMYGWMTGWGDGLMDKQMCMTGWGDQTNGWMDKQMFGWMTNGQIDVWTMYGWMNGRMSGQMDGQRNKRMNGWIDE